MSTAPHDEAVDTETTDREYQLAGFIVGMLLALLIVVPLAFIIIG